MTPIAPTVPGGPGGPTLDATAWLPDRTGETRLLLGAFAAAAAVHVVLIAFLPLPEADPPPVVRPVPPPRGPALRFMPIEPPPLPEITDVRATVGPRRIPLPDPAPPALEPLRERSAPVASAAPPLDALPLPARAEAPRGDQPAALIPGVAGVSHPVPIEATRVQPDYPEVARQGRIEGAVTLQVVVDETGAVRDPVVLRVEPERWGFARAAADAVRRWRYEPARRAGAPVRVTVIVHVTFELR